MTKNKKHNMVRKLAAFLACALVLGAAAQYLAPKNAYAANLELIGEAAPYITIDTVDNKLFTISNILPGETIKDFMFITNNSTLSSLSVEVKNLNTTDTSVNFLEMLDIQVALNGVPVSSGFPGRGEVNVAGITNPYYFDLGEFNPSPKRAELQISVKFNHEKLKEISEAKEIDMNAFQGAIAELQWIFTAEFPDGPGPQPSSGPGTTGRGDRGGTATTTGDVTTPGETTPAETAVLSESSPEGAMDTPESESATTLEEQTPLGVPDDFTLEDEDTPLGVKEMPTTGERSLLYYITVGVALMIVGVILLQAGRKKKTAK